MCLLCDPERPGRPVDRQTSTVDGAAAFERDHNDPADFNDAPGAWELDVD